MMILSILSAALTCEWDLSSIQEASITTVTILITRSICMYHTQVVFFGFLCGSPVWGILADKIGRKKVRNTCALHRLYRPCAYVCVCMYIHICIGSVKPLHVSVFYIASHK